MFPNLGKKKPTIYWDKQKVKFIKPFWRLVSKMINYEQLPMDCWESNYKNYYQVKIVWNVIPLLKFTHAAAY